LLVGTACLLLSLVPSAGCGRSGVKPAEAPIARQALRETLDTWQKGGRPEELLARSPAIRVRDPEWRAGHRLLGYQVEREDPFAAELRCQVVLTVEAPDKKTVQKKAVYAIGTSPAITVVREEDP
jgi:hypothetical protein